jgi:hypothetical protein
MPGSCHPERRRRLLPSHCGPQGSADVPLSLHPRVGRCSLMKSTPASYRLARKQRTGRDTYGPSASVDVRLSQRPTARRCDRKLMPLPCRPASKRLSRPNHYVFQESIGVHLSLHPRAGWCDHLKRRPASCHPARRRRLLPSHYGPQVSADVHLWLYPRVVQFDRLKPTPMTCYPVRMQPPRRKGYAPRASDDDCSSDLYHSRGCRKLHSKGFAKWKWRKGLAVLTVLSADVVRLWAGQAGSMPNSAGEACWVPHLYRLESAERQWQTVWEEEYAVLSRRWEFLCHM